MTLRKFVWLGGVWLSNQLEKIPLVCIAHAMFATCKLIDAPLCKT